MSGAAKEPRLIEPRYGRLLDDFQIGDIYHHPWEVTIDDGLLAMFAASFLDPNPLYSSRRYGRELGFRDRVIHPMVLMNLALSFTVHDISEQAIAHLAYIDLRFPSAAYAGDTLTVASEILAVRQSESKPDRGVVHLRTTGINQNGEVIVTFERRALIPAGRLEGRAHPESGESATLHIDAAQGQRLPKELNVEFKLPERKGRPRGFFEDFDQGDVILHPWGRTVGASEHMQLTMLSRNSHPLHFDEVYSRERSFTATRVVEGGLVFAWICSLASRDTSANALWEMSYDRGNHPAPVLTGDTLFAASRVIEKREYSERAGIVRFHLIGIKNEEPYSLIETGFELFDGKPNQKIFEIERDLLLPRA